MRTKNLVVAPCGNKSFLFKESWMKYNDQRQFDICLLFYHDEVHNPLLYQSVEYFFHLKDFKYHMLHKLFTTIHPEWLHQYEYFYFLDDDIAIDTRNINSMFQASRAFQAWISQASLTQSSFCSWPMFKTKAGSYCRFVGQIEVMAPLFSQEALIKCLPSFIGNRSSWGVDSVWPKLLGYPKDKLVVFDAIQMEHTLPVGGGELYNKIGVNPHEEWQAIVQKYQAKKHNYREYGRLQLVNSKSNRHSFLYFQFHQWLMKRKQAWNDYDLMSRVKNQKKKFLKKV